MKIKSGFTLIELMVVVLIMGILASMGVPYYYKTVETTKATDSVAIGHLLGNANRMFKVDNPGMSISGIVTNNPCNNVSCASAGTSSCRLIACGYVAKQDWDNSSYDFYVCNGGAGGPCCGSRGTEIGMSCTRRKPGAGSPYNTWGYRFYDSGACESLGSGVPDCPRF